MSIPAKRRIAHHRYLDQRILHRWIAEAVPLLQEMDTQQVCSGKGGLPPLELVVG
jgi:hypothetical protein